MIDKRTLETILSDQREELDSKTSEELCSRMEQGQIDLHSPQAQVVIGVRRSGKSTLCYQALRDAGVKFAYVDFDDERLATLRSDQLNDVLEVLYKLYGSFDYIFLDEVQNVEGWHLFVNRMLRRKMHVLITGSNAKLLSGELATHLTGRNKEIPLMPFSFRTYCEAKRVDTSLRTTKAEAFRRAAFDDYLRQGGFPELLTIDDHRTYIQGLVDNILRRDIEQRYRIAYRTAFEKMAHHLLNISPTVTVAKDLATLFHFTEHTARNYVEYLKQAYLLAGIQKYSPKSKIRAVQEKVYAIDVALMDQREGALAGENLGHRLETIVLVHLLRLCRLEGRDVYYLSDRYAECDFVVCRHNRVEQAIQVSYDITSDKTRRREVNGLLMAARQTGCTDLLLLTDHESRIIEEDGRRIRVQPTYEWCLETEATMSDSIASLIPNIAVR